MSVQLSGVVVGDRIVSVNQRSVTSRPRVTIAALIKQSGNSVDLGVVYDPLRYHALMSSASTCRTHACSHLIISLSLYLSFYLSLSSSLIFSLFLSPLTFSDYCTCADGCPTAGQRARRHSNASSVLRAPGNRSAVALGAPPVRLTMTSLLTCHSLRPCLCICLSLCLPLSIALSSLFLIRILCRFVTCLAAADCAFESIQLGVR